MKYKIIEIIDGDTFKVSPEWKWNAHTSGTLVRLNGYNAPEKDQEGYREAKEKLENLILNKEVELKNPIRVTDGRLLCDVYYEEKNLTEHLPEYKA